MSTDLTRLDMVVNVRFPWETDPAFTYRTRGWELSELE